MVIKARIDPAASMLDDRQEPRRAMQLETSGLLPGGLEANVTVHNLSTAGLLIETDLSLNEGEVLLIELPETGPSEARIVWRSENLYGCAFAESLPTSALAAAQLKGPALSVRAAEPFPEPAPEPAQSSLAIAEPLGLRLNRLRRERGLTLAQVAEALEVSKPTVWAWEKGKANPLPERIGAIAQALGVPVKELSQSHESDKGRSVIEDCRARIATAYGANPKNIRIMIEV